MPTNTLLTHCRRYGSTGDVVRIPEDLQAAWLQGTQHGDALVFSSGSGVVRSLGKRNRAAASFLRIRLFGFTIQAYRL